MPCSRQKKSMKMLGTLSECVHLILPDNLFPKQIFPFLPYLQNKANCVTASCLPEIYCHNYTSRLPRSACLMTSHFLKVTLSFYKNIKSHHSKAYIVFH